MKWNKPILPCLLLFFLLPLAFSQNKGKRRNEKPHKKDKGAITTQKQPNSTLFENVFYQGIIKYAQGDEDEALTYFLQAFSEDSTQPAPAYYIASIYLQKKQIPEALPYARKAYELNPQNLHYALLYADLLSYSKGSKVEEAIRIVESIGKRYPNELTITFHLIELYLAKKNYKQAIREIEKIEQRIGNNPEITREKIRLLLIAGLKEQAVSELKRLIEHYPNEEAYWLQLYQLYLELGKKDSAESLLQEYYELNPSSTTAIFSLLKLYIQQEKWEQIKTLLNELIQNPTLSPQLKVDYLSSLYMNYPDRLPYFDYAKQLIHYHPNSASGYLLLGDLYNSKLMLDSAYVYYKQALTLDETNIRLWEYLITMEMQRNQWDSVVSHATQASSIFPYHPLFYYYNAIALFQLKNYQHCVEQLQEVIALGSSDATFLSEVYTLLGDAYHYLQQHENSDSAYEKAISYNPNNTIALNNYAYFLSLRKVQLDKAEKMSEKTLQLQPNVPTYLDTYGWIQFQKGNVKKAQQYIERAYKMSKDPEIVEHLGDIYYELRDLDKALELWKEAATLDPNNENLKRKIQQHER